MADAAHTSEVVPAPPLTKSIDVPDNDGSLRVAGIKLTDLIAVFAFVLALLAHLSFLHNYMAGAIITLLPPELLTIECIQPTGPPDRCAGRNLVLRATPMAYRNRGSSTYDAILMHEQAELTIGSEKLRLHWHYFTDRTLGTDRASVAKPVVLSGGVVTGHETQFLPRIRTCLPGQQQDCRVNPDHMPWTRFLELINPAGNAKVRTITAEFTAKILDADRSWLQRILFGDHSLNVRCTIDIDDLAVETVLSQKGWYFVRACRHT